MLVLFDLQAISFIDCSDLWVKGLRVVDSPQMHMAILNSRRVNVANLRLVSYEFSPNTDGIHIQNSRHVHIEMSTIETGKNPLSPLTIGLTMQFIICLLVCMQVMIAFQLEIMFMILK